MYVMSMTKYVRMKRELKAKKAGQCKTKTTDCGLRTADCRLQTGVNVDRVNADYRLQTIYCISCCHFHYRELTVNKPVIASVIFRLTEEQETAKRLSLRLA